MTQKAACIIQARRTSSRLPDKVLMPLAGKPVIDHVIERCKKAPNISDVILATSHDDYHDELADRASANNITAYRGSLDDVLDRYYQASKLTDAKYIVRITGDCPLLDPQLIGNLVKNAIEAGVDYASTSGWPHGLDCEFITKEALELSANTAVALEDREHVTLWARRNEAITKWIYHSPDPSLYRDYRLTLDYPEDLELLTKIAEAHDGQIPHDHRKLITYLKENPKIALINKECSNAWQAANRDLQKRAATAEQNLKQN